MNLTAAFAYLSVILQLLPVPSYTKFSAFPPVSNPIITMSGLDLTTMKQLLAEQSQSLISELKAQVKTEVSEQLAPHAVRLDQLNDDQALLKKQLSEITKQLQPKASTPNTIPNNTSSSAPNLTPQVTMSPYSTPTQSTSPADMLAIEKAKCTLNFSPITNDDLARMKNNQAEDVSIEELMKRAFNEFLGVNMNIPTSTVSKMLIRNISHSQEIDFQTISVEFYNMCPVNTIFKYVKNLAPEQKVSIFIPDILASRNEKLKNLSYQMRNDDHIKHKTVIKYLGYDLCLQAKRPGDRSWFTVTPPLQNIQPAPKYAPKRHRVEDSDHSDDDSNKKVKKTSENPTPHTKKDPPIFLRKDSP